MITPDNLDLSKLLQEGISAVKQGDRVRGRELLLQVVEQDDQIESAWLWLSAAVDDAQDQATALENVLTLNPTNAGARERLAHLRQTSEERSAAPDAFKRYLPEAPLEPDDGIDEPLQCVYCGKLTGENDRACPHCRQNLYWRKERQKQISDFLRMGMLLVGIMLALGLIEALGPLFAVGVAQLGDKINFPLILGVPGVKEFLGNFLQLPPAVAQTLVSVYFLQTGLLFFLLLGLSQRLSLAYYATLSLMIVDLLGSVYLAISGYLGWLGAGINVVFVLAILGLLFSADREFAVNEERLLTRPDMTARSALDFYKRGHYYRKLGMWSLAVAQWRKAVGLAPKEVQYYKDLGVGYAQIKRFDRSLRALEEAQHQAPDDRDVPEMIKLVREQATSGK